MKTWQKILSGIAVVAICAYAIAISLISNRQKDESVCRNADIIIADSTDRQMVGAVEIMQYLKKTGVSPVGKMREDIDYNEVEKQVSEHPMVESAECYSTLDGTTRIIIHQRVPVMRIISSDGNYFIDRNRQPMPVRSTTAAYVPVVTGRISRRMAQEEMFDFVGWLRDNSFWSAQIEQINVNSQMEIELTPRVGSGKILLGKLTDNYPERMQRLYRLYTEGFQKSGWKEYREIDLRYDKQIVFRP